MKVTQPQDTLQRIPQLLRVLAAAILCAGLLAGAAAEMACAPRLPNLTIEGAEATLSPVMLGVGSVFMRIVNSGKGRDELVSVRISIPVTSAEFHETKDGRMARVNRIAIPAGTTVELKPGGLHIMLFRLPKEIKEGSEITLSLMFEKSGEKRVPVKLTKPSALRMRR